MGAVYQAIDENLSCVVAVKETFAVTDEQRRALRREAEFLATITDGSTTQMTMNRAHSIARDVASGSGQCGIP